MGNRAFGRAILTALALVLALAFAPVNAQQKADNSALADDPDFVARDPKYPTTLKYDVPTEFKIRVLDGPDYQLTKHRGHVVFFNVFATWCPPCNEEMPALLGFEAAHTDDTDLVFIDVGEYDDTVRKFRKKYVIPYTIAMDPSQLYFGYIAKQEAFPMTFVFRPDGTLYASWSGAVSRWWFETARRHAIATAATPAP